MKDIKGIRGEYYIAALIAEGEHERQDFKFAIPDSRKIARSLSAFANHSGGRLLIGVRDNGSIAGIRSEEEIYMVEQAAELYCDPPQKLRIDAFKVEDGKLVVRVEIDQSHDRPVFVKEADGEMKAYYRVADENILAPDLMVRAWQRSAGDSGGFTLDALSRCLLNLATAEGGTDAEALMVAAHVSRARAEEAIVSLAAAGVIKFRHSHSGFKLIVAEDS